MKAKMEIAIREDAVLKESRVHKQSSSNIYDGLSVRSVPSFFLHHKLTSGKQDHGGDCIHRCGIPGRACVLL